MEAGQLMFKIDTCTQKLSDAAQTIGQCVAQLAEQRDETLRQLEGRVRYAELLSKAMAAYLTAFGQFRGKTPDEVYDYFKTEISPSIPLPEKSDAVEVIPSKPEETTA